MSEWYVIYNVEREMFLHGDKLFEFALGDSGAILIYEGSEIYKLVELCHHDGSTVKHYLRVIKAIQSYGVCQFIGVGVDMGNMDTEKYFNWEDIIRFSYG